jgi:hypothetical protein
LFKVAFDLEVEVLGEIAGEIDASPAQPETVFDFGLAKISVESEGVAVLKVDLNESAKDKFEFRSARNDVDRGVLLYGYALLNVGFAIITWSRQ